MGFNKAQGSGLSKSCWFGIGVLSIGFVLFMFFGYRVIKAYEAFKLAQPILKNMNSVGGTKYIPLPMETHYSKQQKLIDFPESYPWKSDQEFTKSILPDKDKALKLAREILGKGFYRDWREGVEHLDDAQPRWMVFSKLAQSVNYQKCRKLAKHMNSLGRLLRLEHRPQEALRLHLSSFSVPRQMLSIQRQNTGMTLIDAMITIAILGDSAQGLLDLGEHTSWQQDLFSPVFQERFEGVHDLFPLVAEAMELERTIVASFFNDINEKASKRAGYKVSIADTKAIQRRTDRYIPSNELLRQPYCLAKDKLDEYQERLVAASSIHTSDYVKGIFFPMGLVEKVMQMISIPNINKAYLRECQRLAMLRGCYLAYAIAGHYARNGAYPNSLNELGPEVKVSMRIDPFSGETFRYRNEGKTFLLWSTGVLGKAAMDKPLEKSMGKSIVIVPWERKKKY